MIRRVYQLAEAKDVDGFVAAFTEDGTFTDESIEVVYRGPDELGKTVEIYATARCTRPATSWWSSSLFRELIWAR
jgi:hypothetical protein